MSEPILTEEAKRDFELSRQGVKLQGWVAVLAFAIVAAVLVWKLDIPDCIRAWKCQPAEVQNEH